MSPNQLQSSCSCRKEKKNFLYVAGDTVTINIRGSLEKLEHCQKCCRKDKWTIKEFFSECENNPDCLIDLFRLSRIQEKSQQEISFTKNKYQNISEAITPKHDYEPTHQKQVSKKEIVKRTTNEFYPQKETKPVTKPKKDIVVDRKEPAEEAVKLKKVLSNLEQDDTIVKYKKDSIHKKKVIETPIKQERSKNEQEDEDKDAILRKYHYLMVDNAISCKVPSQEKLVKNSSDMIQIVDKSSKLSMKSRDNCDPYGKKDKQEAEHSFLYDEDSLYATDNNVSEENKNERRFSHVIPRHRTRYSIHTAKSDRSKFQLGKKSIEMRQLHKKKNIVWQENLSGKSLPLTQKPSVASNTSNILYILREAIRKDYEIQNRNLTIKAKETPVKEKNIYRWFPCLTIFRKKKRIINQVDDGTATPLSIITVGASLLEEDID